MPSISNACNTSWPTRSKPEAPLDTATLLSGLLFSSLGVGYFIYGKKQQRQAAFFGGLALLGYPYLVSDLWQVWVIGLALLAVPYIWKN